METALERLRAAEGLLIETDRFGSWPGYHDPPTAPFLRRALGLSMQAGRLIGEALERGAEGDLPPEGARHLERAAFRIDAAVERMSAVLSLFR